MVTSGFPSDQTYDVIVVGAGAAGIAAARAVQSSNRSVLVLEAMDRAGGRCWTDTSLGVPYEPGAQFISQAQSLNTVLYPIAKQLGIDTIDGAAFPPVFFDLASGTKSSDLEQADFFATFGLVHSALLSYGLSITLGEPDVSARQVIAGAGLADADYLKLVEQIVVSVVDGGDPADQSVEDLYNFTQFSPVPFVYPANDSLFVPSGYGAFLAGLASGLPIQVSCPVQSVTYGGSTVAVKTVGGATYLAKTVIVTASVNVLQAGTIDFSPALPAEYTTALSGITMGHAYKALLQFKGNPFVNKSLGVEAGKMANIIPLGNRTTPTFFANYLAERHPGAGPFLVMACEGEDAVKFEDLGPEAAGQTICKMLEKTFPGIAAAWTGQILASSWKSNPYTLGCISYAKPGKASARVQLAKPINNQVWFAGEACSVHSHSQVHGAWASGTDAGYAALGAVGALVRNPSSG